MGFCVCGGALMTCSFGVAPVPLNVLPKSKVMTSMPIANIMDYVPILNIPPFGMCNSMSNPTVVASTAAKMGVFTPAPCVPNVVSPWTPGCTTVLVANQPALNDSSQAMCLWGGVIKFSTPGQFTIMIP